MMISPGSSDLAGLFALLTAVSDPEAAKASLKEIASASDAYEQSVQDSRVELKKANDELDARKAEVQKMLDEATSIRDEFNLNHDIRKKQLDDQDVFLGQRTSNLNTAENALLVRENDIKARENSVSSRESLISIREADAQHLNETASAVYNDYSARLASLQTIATTPAKSIVMSAATGLIGQTMSS